MCVTVTDNTTVPFMNRTLVIKWSILLGLLQLFYLSSMNAGNTVIGFLQMVDPDTLQSDKSIPDSAVSKWAGGFLIGGFYPAFTGSLSSDFHPSAGFMIGAEVSYRRYFIRAEGGWVNVRVSDDFTYDGVWKHNYPLDGTDVWISVGHSVVLGPNVTLKPAFTYSTLYLETDDRLKDYTGEGKNLVLDFWGLSVITSLFPQQGDDALYAIQLSAGVNFPLSHSGREMFTGSILRFGCILGIGLF